MDLIRTKKDRTQLHLLCKDHIPNFAMKNEFHTNSFSLKLNHIEIHEEEYYGYIIEDDGVFLCMNITICNLTNQPLELSKDEFLIHFDSEGPYEPEEYFNVENQFTDILELKPNESKSGLYIYIIDKLAKKIAIKYYEYYDDFTSKEYRLRYIIAQ